MSRGRSIVNENKIFVGHGLKSKRATDGLGLTLLALTSPFPSLHPPRSLVFGCQRGAEKEGEMRLVAFDYLLSRMILHVVRV